MKKHIIRNTTNKHTGIAALIMTVTLFSGTLFLTACGSESIDEDAIENTDEDYEEADTKASQKDKQDKKNEQDTSLKDSLSDKLNSKLNKVSNPLADMTVEYPGDKKRDDNETASLLQFFITDNPDIPKEEILVATVDDFDNNSEYEAFIFVGELYSDEYEEYYTGDIWFTDGRTSTKLNEYPETWWSVDGFMSFDGRKYAYATVYYATGGIARVWSVYNGKVGSSEIDGLGSVSVTADGDICITDSTYDTFYDCEMGIMIGHSWKPYYFYYDKASDAIIERGGAYVSKSDIDIISGTDISARLEADDHDITFGLYRDNGILTVNYRDIDDKGDITFANANYNCKTKEFLNAWSEGSGELYSSNYGGIYLSTLSDIKASYPEVNTTSEEIDLTVSSFNNVVGIRNSIVLSGRNADGEWISVVVDKDTQLAPNDAALFNDREDYMSAVDWIGNLILIEQESDWGTMKVEGVYRMKVTNGHADYIEGLYWWD